MSTLIDVLDIPRPNRFMTDTEQKSIALEAMDFVKAHNVPYATIYEYCVGGAGSQEFRLRIYPQANPSKDFENGKLMCDIYTYRDWKVVHVERNVDNHVTANTFYHRTVVVKRGNKCS